MVLVPGAGDDVQALKAGIMEIADVYVVNKADRDGADRMVTSIESNLALQAYAAGSGGRQSSRPRPRPAPAWRSCGRRFAAFRAHSAHVARGGAPPARSEYRLRELLARRFLAHVETRCSRQASSTALVERIAARELDPYSAAADVLRRALADGRQP